MTSASSSQSSVQSSTTQEVLQFVADVYKDLPPEWLDIFQEMPQTFIAELWLSECFRRIKAVLNSVIYAQPGRGLKDLERDLALYCNLQSKSEGPLLSFRPDHRNESDSQGQAISDLDTLEPATLPDYIDDYLQIRSWVDPNDNKLKILMKLC